MWTRADFDNAANEIGKQFAASGGTSRINDLATKIAMDNQLNQEGIQTLVRLANVSAFQELFTKRAGSEDRMIEFEVGDPDLVISNIYSNVKQAAVQEQRAVRASSYDRAMDYYSPLTEKTAGDSSSDEERASEDAEHESEDDADMGLKGDDDVLGKKIDMPDFDSSAPMIDKKAMAKFNVKRAQEAIDEESRRLMHEWGMALEKAAQSVRVVFGYPTFDKHAFYADVVADLGVDVVSELMAINVLNGGEASDLNREKLASAPEHRISTFKKTRETAEILAFVKQASAARQKRESYTTALNWLDTKMTELLK
jgi:hypothetical protein